MTVLLNVSCLNVSCMQFDITEISNSISYSEMELTLASSLKREEIHLGSLVRSRFFFIILLIFQKHGERETSVSLEEKEEMKREGKREKGLKGGKK